MSNANGIAYLCNRCQVKGLARKGTRLQCWCCDGRDLKTKGVVLKIAEPHTAYYSSYPEELTTGAQRSDDN